MDRHYLGEQETKRGERTREREGEKERERNLQRGIVTV